MLQKLRAHLHRFNPVSDEEFEEISLNCTPRKLRKHQHVLKEGEIAHHVFVVMEGCLRMRRTDSSHHDRTLELATEFGSIADRVSLATGEPSEVGIEAVTHCEVIAVDAEITAKLHPRNPAFARRFGIFMHQMLAVNQRRINTLLTLTAEERYMELLNTQPRIIELAPQHMIASYLGITPSTLSRVRKQLEAKGMADMPIVEG